MPEAGAGILAARPGGFYNDPRLLAGRAANMQRDELNSLLAEIRGVRDRTMAELSDIPESDFAVPVDLPRWNEVRRVLLRFGEHMREHANQLEKAREDLQRSRTMPQHMLAEAERAWGQVLAATTGLEDDDLDASPAPGSWSVRTVLAHMLESEQRYLDAVRRVRADASDRD